jgi:hypothetical protein
MTDGRITIAMPWRVNDIDRRHDMTGGFDRSRLLATYFLESI